MRKFYLSGKEGLGFQGLWVDPELTNELGRWRCERLGGGWSPDYGGETVSQELLLLLGDRGPLVRGDFLTSLRLLPGVLPLWQLPGAGRGILSGLGKPPRWGRGHEQ